jgi:hypothetical protein
VLLDITGSQTGPQVGSPAREDHSGEAAPDRDAG